MKHAGLGAKLLSAGCQAALLGFAAGLAWAMASAIAAHAATWGERSLLTRLLLVLVAPLAAVGLASWHHGALFCNVFLTVH